MNILQESPAEDLDAMPSQVSFWEAFAFWLKLGFISFGGPAGQISTMNQELVENRRWISERRFLHALNYRMVLPRPEASSLSGLTESAAKSGKTAHFRPCFRANRTTIRLKPVQNCARLPHFSLRPIKPDRLLEADVHSYRRCLGDKCPQHLQRCPPTRMR
jgi:hypothetical protein